MKVIFFGTPGFALPSFHALARSRHEVLGVVCQPDRPAGRGLRTEAPPVAGACREMERPLIQPETLRRGEMEALFRDGGVEAGVVVAYGKILRPWMLALPRYGFVNVHASLLPKYRGAAPVARAVMAGESLAGVSLMKLDVGMDTGPVYFSRATPVGPDETAGELEARLAAIGAEALVEALDGIEAGTLAARPQEGEPSLAPPLAREDGKILWDRSAAAVHDRVRGVNPWPGGTTAFRGQEIRIWRTALAPREGRAEGGMGNAECGMRNAECGMREGSPGPEGNAEFGMGARSGEVLEARRGLLRIACGTGAVDLLELQCPGKKRVSAADFLNGMRVKAGERFAGAGCGS